MTTTVGRVHDGLPNAVYIGRPAAGQPWNFGNPFPIGSRTKSGRLVTRQMSIEMYKRWVTESQDPAARWIRENIYRLKGMHLQCFCKPHACHGDWLAQLADKT